MDVIYVAALIVAILLALGLVASGLAKLGDRIDKRRGRR